MCKNSNFGKISNWLFINLPFCCDFDEFCEHLTLVAHTKCGNVKKLESILSCWWWKLKKSWINSQ